MALEKLRCEGNIMFANGCWSKAIAKYGEYIALLRKDDGDQGARSNLVIGYSNRAEALLKLNKYVEALDDCERALKVDKTHLKSLMRKARALEGLHLHEEVAQTCKELLQNFNLGPAEKSWAEGVLRIAEEKDRQTRFGDIKSALEEHWKEAKEGPSFLDSAPDTEEFVGPVEIRRTPTMGRGLFATRDVQEGELLLVSNAWTSNRFVIECQVKPMEKMIDKLVHSLEEIVHEAKENIQDLSQIQRLIQLDTLGGPYPDDSLYRDVPPMRYFTPVNALPGGSRRITQKDMEYLARALKNDFNGAFLRKVIFDRQLYQHDTKLIRISEIYVLPSLMNHSCLPNVSVIALYNSKASKIFRASRRIRDGEELFHAYHNIFCPLDERRMLFGGIPCKCERCALEFCLLSEISFLNYLASECTDLAAVKESKALWQCSDDDLARLQRRCITALNTVDALFREIPKLAKLPEEKHHWIRAAFTRFARLLLDPSMKKLPDLPEERAVMRSEMILNTIVSMRTVDPASAIALTLCSEASKEIQAAYNVETGCIKEQQGIALLLNAGLRIIELTYGPELSCKTTFKIFISSAGRVNDLDFTF